MRNSQPANYRLVFHQMNGPLKADNWLEIMHYRVSAVFTLETILSGTIQQQDACTGIIRIIQFHFHSCHQHFQSQHEHVHLLSITQIKQVPNLSPYIAVSILSGPNALFFLYSSSY